MLPKLSIIYPYYNQPEMLKRQVDLWYSYPPEVETIVVDDGSQEKPAPHIPGARVYRIKEDIPWNICGAKNLGALVASADWLLFCDIDHLFTAENIQKIIDSDLDPTKAYVFSRTDHRGEQLCTGEGLILINRYFFDEFGGFDEDFAGHYGYEDMYLMDKIGRQNMVTLEGVVCSEHSEDPEIANGGTPGLTRDADFNKHLYGRKLETYGKGPYPVTPRLRFSWEEVHG